MCYSSDGALAMTHESTQTGTFWSPRRGRVSVSLLALVLLTAVQAFAQTSEGLRVVPLVKDDQVFVSFTLSDGFTEEVRAAIQSGLKTTFTYAVELRLDVPGWVDRTMGLSTATSSVEYDNLTRRYSLTRTIDGKVVDMRVAEDERAVRNWLTVLQRLPLFRTTMLEGNREYYVTVRATARPSNGSILWPFSSGTSAQAKFTFIK
ncbi:MAG TPA: DUF4390 domain-containing protein [Vicinamibacterales bacterium]|nr:DUF4390 domain-containing protein [Vicinamibacterales bacterium]